MKIKLIKLSVLVSSLVLILSYQNCAQQNFAYDYEGVMASSGAQMQLEDGKAYTNKKNLKVEFLGNFDAFTEMRVSSSEDMTNLPWQKFEKKTSFDLGSDWASGGTKDGRKMVYAELRIDAQSSPLELKGMIGLDTVPPVVEAQGILSKGLQGEVFSKNQKVPVQWTYRDPQSSTGFASGLDPAQGMKIGYTQSDDCSKNVLWVSDYSAPTNKFNLSWPGQGPLDTFYVCVLVKDAAENSSTMLSQPLTSLWRVYAGDNNQGNGGSITAGNVRFKIPSAMAKDSKNNIYILDAQFNNIRKVLSTDVSASRTVSSFAGTGQRTAVIEGNILSTGLGSLTNTLGMDSQDRLYFTSGNSIYRASEQADGTYAVKKLIQACGGRVAIRKVGAQESLLVASMCEFAPGLASGGAYIYEIPLSVMEGKSGFLTLDDLKKNYILVGNGITPFSTFAVPSTQVLSNKDGADNKFSTGNPGTITTGPSGEIYFATLADGSGRGWGNHTIRRLTSLGKGQWKQELLSKMPWTNQIQHIRSGDGKEEYLLVSAVSDVLKIDLTPLKSNLPVIETKPLAHLPNRTSYGVIATMDAQNKWDIYVSITPTSQIHHYDAQFNLLEKWGRPIFDDKDKVANLAILGQPEGLVQDRQGNTYFFDAFNSVIRQVSADGSIKTLSGQAGIAKTGFYNGVDFTQATYDGLAYFGGGYHYQMTGNFSADNKVKKIYLAEASRVRLHELDLLTGKVQTVGGYDKTLNRADPTHWTLAGIGILNLNGSPQLLANRACYTNGCGGTTYKYTGALTMSDMRSPASEKIIAGDIRINREEAPATPIATNTDPLAASLYAVSTIETDSTTNMYFSSSGFFMTSMKSGKPGPLVNIAINSNRRASLPFFQLIESAQNRLFIYPSGERLYAANLDLNAVHPAEGPNLKSEALCLPGTFLNSPRGMAQTKDGNLLIADSANGRILEYFIRDQNAQIALSKCK